MSCRTVPDVCKLQFTDVVGTFGKWQLIICLQIWAMLAINSMHNFVIIFHAPDVDHWCVMPEEIKKNVSDEEWISDGIPRYGEQGVRSKCEKYATWDIEQENRTVVKCDQWTYDTSKYPNTIVGKFNLVCGRQWMIQMLKSVYMGGYMGAGILCGFSDRFGRRPLILGSITLFLVCSFSTAFSSSFIMMLVLRFFLALGMTTCTTLTFVLQNEIVGPRTRIIVNYVRGNMFPFGMLVLVGIAYFIRDWFWLQIAITIPGVFLAVSMIWFLPESPRFLLTQGDVGRASKLLKEACRRNRVEIRNEGSVLQDLISGIQKDEKEKASSHASWFDLFRTPEIRKRTLVVYFIWFVIIFEYYGITYNINRLHGDVYTNFSISCAVDICVILIFMVISHHFGRRKTLAGISTLCGCALFSSFFVPKEYPLVETVLLLAGKALLQASIIEIYTFTAEIFPTVLRSIGLGTSSTFSRFGGIAAPFAWGKKGGTYGPNILFGVLITIAALSILLLPETKNRNVSDTIKEARNFNRRQEPPKNSQEVKRNTVII